MEESGHVRLERELLVHELRDTNARRLLALEDARELASLAEAAHLRLKASEEA